MQRIPPATPALRRTKIGRFASENQPPSRGDVPSTGTSDEKGSQRAAVTLRQCHTLFPAAPSLFLASPFAIVGPKKAGDEMIDDVRGDFVKALPGHAEQFDPRVCPDVHVEPEADAGLELRARDALIVVVTARQGRQDGDRRIGFCLARLRQHVGASPALSRSLR